MFRFQMVAYTFLVNDNIPGFVSVGDDGGDLINCCMGLSLALPAHSQTHVRLITSAGHTTTKSQCLLSRAVYKSSRANGSLSGSRIGSRVRGLSWPPVVSPGLPWPVGAPPDSESVAGPVVSRGLPWSPVVSRGLPWSPVE